MALAFIEHWNDRQTVVDDVFAAARFVIFNKMYTKNIVIFLVYILSERELLGGVLDG